MPITKLRVQPPPSQSTTLQGLRYTDGLQTSRLISHAERWWPVWSVGIGVARTVGLGYFWYTHWESAPMTERRRFNFMTQEQTMTYEKEHNPDYHVLSQAIETAEMVPGFFWPNSNPTVMVLETVFRRLITAAGLNDDIVQWEVNIMNAKPRHKIRILLTGNVLVNSTALNSFYDEAGLAFGLSLGLARVVTRQDAEHASYDLFTRRAAVPTVQLLSTSYFWKPGLVVGIPCLGAFAAILWYRDRISMVQERERLRVALVIMAKAGYDPRGAVTHLARNRAVNKRVIKHEKRSNLPTSESNLESLTRSNEEMKQLIRDINNTTPEILRNSIVEYPQKPEISATFNVIWKPLPEGDAWEPWVVL